MGIIKVYKTLEQWSNNFMSVGVNISLNEQKKAKKEKLMVFPEVSKVNLNSLMKRVKEEERKARRSNLIVAVIALSAATVFGIILTL